MDDSVFKALSIFFGVPLLILAVSIFLGCSNPERSSKVEPVVSGTGRIGVLATIPYREMGQEATLYLYENEELEIHCVIYQDFKKGGISCIPNSQSVK